MWNQEGPKNVESIQDGRSADPKDGRAATFGTSVCVKGEIAGSEDLTVDGQVEGKINLPDHMLTIGPNATILADIIANRVTVFGSVIGTITARDKVDLRKSGSVEGTVTCGRIAVQEGAHLSGKLTTQTQRKPAVKETAAAKVA
jgi:cytoskeletal protein CcmA (bactofilin family)